ncbi:ATP synthase subunit I [Dyella sp. 2HG41-7]|uniref:ATP synthase subunit I n=1 Tax=Dyella sp. 2HG41-7 TaxID=2883239 RepID=UPI001F1911C0
MLNSLTSGRRLALRLLLWQLVVAIVVGLAFSVRGFRWAIAAAAGATIVALGTALLSTRLFGQVSHAGLAFFRFLTGMLLKWVVIVGGLIIVMVKFKLPPLAAITGLVAAYAVNLLAFRFKG